MAVITKKVGKKFYAYISERQGSKVVHKYLGPAADLMVQKSIAAYQEVYAVPERFRRLFWDVRLADIHVRKNAGYIIERVLEMGSLDAVNWLQRLYPVRKISDVLCTSRGLSQKSKYFWNLWFGLENT